MVYLTSQAESAPLAFGPFAGPQAALRSTLLKHGRRLDLARGDRLPSLDTAVFLLQRGAVATPDETWGPDRVLCSAAWARPDRLAEACAQRQSTGLLVNLDALQRVLTAKEMAGVIAWSQTSASPSPWQCIGVLQASTDPAVADWTQGFADALGIDAPHSSAPGATLESDRRSRHVVALLDPAHGLAGWLGQVDRVVVVCRASDGPQVGAIESQIWALPELRRPDVSLVLLHDAEVTHPRGTRRWLAERTVENHHHCRIGRRTDTERVARLLTGRGVGLVLSGGGALGTAHLGVFKALGDHGIPIDSLGGTSSGGGIAGQMATGLDFEALRDCNAQHFFETNPFRRPAIPILALTPRATVDAVAHSLYGRLDIEDLWLPFFCVSTNLTQGRLKTHRSGPLWRAVRATTAVPGLATPFVESGEVLVDGGVLCNLPTVQMRETGVGAVIAVDVCPKNEARGVDFEYEQMPGLASIIKSRLNPWARAARVPTVPYVLARVASLGDAQCRSESHAAADLLFAPPLDGFKTSRYTGFDDMLAAGYAYATQVLDGLNAQQRALLQAPPGKIREPTPPARRGPKSPRRGRALSLRLNVFRRGQS